MILAAYRATDPRWDADSRALFASWIVAALWGGEGWFRVVAQA